MKTSFILLAIFLFSIFNVTYGQKNISVDFSTTIDTVKDLLGGNLLFDNTADLLHNEGIEMIRSHDFHHMLDYSDYSSFWLMDDSGNYSLNMDFDPDNPDDYTWHNADSVISLIKNNNFDIFFRIGVSYPSGNPLPPYLPPYDSPSDTMSFTRFASLCKHVVRHFNDGWDNGLNTNIRYWEIWNEPGGQFWDGTVLQFYKMYQAVSDSLKTYDPDLKVGAPGAYPATSINSGHPAYRENFINFCSNNNLPLDFYSWHLYGAKNPYGIKEIADTIRTILDNNGYSDAENIISEINDDLHSSLDTLVISPYGAAYYLSTILTAQKSCIDKMFWYPSCVGIKDRVTGDTILTRTYYGMTCFHELQETTPVVVPNDGDIVVDGNWDSYETNFMVLSSKSEDDEKFSILISNLSSNVNSITLELHGLPFDANDTIRIIKHIISDNYIFRTEEQTLSGDSVLTLENEVCPNPGVLFYQLEKKTNTFIYQSNKGIVIFPNPSNGEITINNVKNQKITIFDVMGHKIVEIPQTNREKISVDLSKYGKGIYFIKVSNNTNSKTEKIVID